MDSNLALGYIYPNSTVIVLHAASCSTCIPDIEQTPWIVSRLHSGLGNEFFPMALAAAHGTDCWSAGQVAQGMEHIKYLGRQVMQDTFDVFVWSCLNQNHLTTSVRYVFNAFAAEGFDIGSRHICGLR